MLTAIMDAVFCSMFLELQNGDPLIAWCYA